MKTKKYNFKIYKIYKFYKNFYFYKMLDEAAKHVREGILLGRTDIIKKLLEEVKQTIQSEKDGKNNSFI